MEENILMMRCTKCGEMNQLPVVHCKRCGARLDFETAEKHMIEAGKPTAASSSPPDRATTCSSRSPSAPIDRNRHVACRHHRTHSRNTAEAL